MTESQEVAVAVVDQQLQQSDESDQPVQRVLQKRFYPHDFVVQKDKNYPYEWSPTFGTVVDPTHPILNIDEFKEHKSRLDNWKYEDGLVEQLFVHWGSSSLLKFMENGQENVGLVDRLLIKGQKVNDGQKSGYVTNSQVKVTLQILGTNHVVTNVESRRLKPISPFVRGVEILYDNKWIGIITAVQRQNTFHINSLLNSQRIQVITEEGDGFMKQDPYWTPGSNYPGQVVRLSARLLENAKWESNGNRIGFLWKSTPLKYLYNLNEGRTVSLKPLCLTVKWLQATPATNEPLPNFNYIPSSNFHLVHCVGPPNYETLQINSIRTFKFDEGKADEQLTSFNSWMRLFRRQFMNETSSEEEESGEDARSLYYPDDSIFTALKKQIKSEIPVRILLKQTFVDVEWEDGTMTRNQEAVKIPIICTVQENPLYRTGTIVERIQGEESSFGVVQHSEDLALSNTNTVYVKWFTDNDDDAVTITNPEEESIYNLRPHPEYTFYKLHTLVFIKDAQVSHVQRFNGDNKLILAATVVDIDTVNGTMTVASETCEPYLVVYPHQVEAVGKRSFWNFFTRKWVVDLLLPHEHQFVDERKRISFTKSTVTNSTLQLQPSTTSLLKAEPHVRLVSNVPETHFYYNNAPPDYTVDFARRVKCELDGLFKTELDGIWICAFEDRMDLLSVLFLGPVDTVYEDSLLLFDLQIPAKLVPLKVQYISFTEQHQPIHPLIATDGTFCVSKLEWKVEESFIADALHQIQSLLFTNTWQVDYPTNLQRNYNEKVLMNLLTSNINMFRLPISPWIELIQSHFSVSLGVKLLLITKWLKDNESVQPPNYPLLPFTKGFQLIFRQKLDSLYEYLQTEDKILQETLFATEYEQFVDGKVSKVEEVAGEEETQETSQSRLGEEVQVN